MSALRHFAHVQAALGVARPDGVPCAKTDRAYQAARAAAVAEYHAHLRASALAEAERAGRGEDRSPHHWRLARIAADSALAILGIAILGALYLAAVWLIVTAP